MATSIYRADGTLVLTCAYPCGEKDLTITYQADYTPNTPNVGLSTSVKNLRFIKTDRTTILGAMSEDLFVVIDTLPKFQLDLQSFKDDEDFLEIPLISTSVKDRLKNTNLGQIGANRVSKLQIKKTPFLRAVLSSNDINTVFSLPADTATHGVQNENSLLSQGWSVSEGVLLNLELVANSASNFASRDLPIIGSSINYVAHDTEINVNISLERTSGTLANAQMRLFVNSYVNWQYADDDSWDPYGLNIGNVYSSWVNVADLMNLSVNATFHDILTFPNTYNSRPIKNAFVAYRVVILAQNITASAWKAEWTRSGNIEVKYQDYVNFGIPSIRFTDIITATQTALGIQIEKSYVGTILDNLYLTSPNGEEFWNLSVLDVLDSIAQLFGLLLQFALNKVNLRAYSIIYSGASVAVPDYCKHEINGRSCYYKFAINDGSNPKLQYANAPYIMWNNEYEGFRNFGTQTTNTLQLKFRINGADFLEKMRSDEKSVYLIEGKNNTIADGSDLPINYQFSASEITAFRASEYASEVLGDVQLSPVIDTTPVFTNPDDNISTRDDINLPTTRLISWQIDSFSIPFYSSLISKVLNGDIIKLSIGGDDYLLTECTCNIEPTQVTITCRKILS